MTRRQLREWRESRGLSQSVAAEWYGVTLRQWQRWESGETPIPPQLPRIIAAEAK